VYGRGEDMRKPEEEDGCGGAGMKRDSGSLCRYEEA